MHDFKGKARKIDDYDLPRLGALIGVGEDELHAFMDVEAAGSGFDSQGRPKMLFEPHLFYRELGPGPKRDEAVKQGLAYPKWGTAKYPKESYTRLKAAMKIDAEAALQSASWGLTQILGKWHNAVGYPTADDMVRDFADDEAAHLEATIKLLKLWHVDDDLRAHRWTPVALAWNGPEQAKHGYDKKLAKAYDKWSKIKDTAWPPKDWTPPVSSPSVLTAETKADLPAASTKDTEVVLADGPKAGETSVVVVQTPKNEPAKPSVSVPKKRTGIISLGAIVAAIIAAIAKYFGG